MNRDYSNRSCATTGILRVVLAWYSMNCGCCSPWLSVVMSLIVWMATGCQETPRPEWPADPSFFGGATETAGVFVGSDTWIGWGRTSHADFEDVEVMTALGAKRDGGKWRTTLLEPLAVCARSGFDPKEDVEKSVELLSTGAGLVASCEIGGTNGESVVAVVGVGTRDIPTVVLAVTCFQLEMPEGWSALRPVNLDDWDRFDSECLPPPR